MYLKISDIIDDYYEDDIDITEVDIIKPERVWALVKEQLAMQVTPVVDELSNQNIDLSDDDTDLTLPMFDSDRVLALVRKQVPGLGTDDSSRPRKKTKLVRILLIAAALTIFMSVTAYAIYLLTMADRAVDSTDFGVDMRGEEVQQYSPVGPNPLFDDEAQPTPGIKPVSRDGDYAQYPAVNGGNEYLALNEWWAFEMNFHAEDDEEKMTGEDLAKYGNYCEYKREVDQLQEIADKYGLRLFQSSNYAPTEDELEDLLGIDSFIPWVEDSDGSHAYVVFDDGSFMANGMSIACCGSDNVVSTNLYRARKGTLSNFLVLGGAPETYAYETYTTADGQSVDLALGNVYSLIFADMDNSYITSLICGGVAPEGQSIELDMDDLKEIADGINFALLDDNVTQIGN